MKYTPVAPPEPPCHVGNKLVFKQGAIAVYAGGSQRGADIYDVNLVIDLTGKVKSKLWTVDKKFKRLKKYLDNPEVLDLYIPDMTAPEYPKDVWDELWSDLVDIAAKTGYTYHNPYKVLVMCLGGHGRTGTVVTSLLFSSGYLESGTDGIGWIRDHYCDHAVETKDQLEYLTSEYGFETKEVVNY